MTDLGWKAHVAADYRAVIMDCYRVVLYRHAPNEKVEQIVGFDEAGVAIVQVHDAGPAFDGFLVPFEALRAIAESVKPGPSKAEVSRLEEALAVERSRVDKVLEAGRNNQREAE